MADHISQKKAQYGPSKGDRCDECRWFEYEKPNGCAIVEGHIEPDMWCMFFHRTSDRRRGRRMMRRQEYARRDVREMRVR